MKAHREYVIEAAAADSELPSEVAQLLLDGAPWLDGTEEINEKLGLALFAEQSSALGLSSNKVQEFVERYNTLVHSYSKPSAMRQGEAYHAIGEALTPYGRADAFGEGDYWLVSDSFSTRTPVIVVFEDFRLPPAAILELQELLNQYNGVFSELRVNTDFGAELTTLRPQ